MATPFDALSRLDHLRARAAHRVRSMATTAAWSVSRQRVAFTVAVCALVSTQALFQPDLYDLFLPAAALRAWADYFGECLLMGVPIMVAATLAERWSARHSRAATIAAAGLAVFAGAAVGGLGLIAYYDDDWSAAFGPRYWVDVAFWTALGVGVVAIYGFQQRAAAAVQKRHQAELDRIALSKQMLEARLQVMRAQIEPHFLFNTLANVKQLCQTDAEGGVRMLDNLVRYLRAALPQMREGESTLGREVDLVEAFLAVVAIRMGSRLDYRVAIPHELRHLPFPPMMLLTLTENAIKHGLNPAPDGGLIEVRAAVHGDEVEVRVADTGVGFGVAPTGGTGVGLANTRSRLAALYGDGAELSLEPNVPTGVVAVIRMPRAPFAPATAA